MIMEKGNWQNKWMGGMVMGKCKDKQRKICIVKIDYKHFKRGYGRLQLGDVYTCHGFFQRSHKFEVDSKAFFHKFIQWFVDKRSFGNHWQLAINKFMKPQRQLYATLGKWA